MTGDPLEATQATNPFGRASTGVGGALAEEGALAFEIDPRRLVDRVYEAIKLAIMDGRIQPGQRLVQDVLAHQFGVSRSPIREAIVRLAQEGLVRLEPHRGAVVRTMSEREIDEIYEVRLILEPYAVERAAELATQEEIERAVAIQEQAEREQASMELADMFRVNGDFHRVVVTPCRNDLLISMLTSLWERQIAFQMFTIYARAEGAIDTMVREHRAIIEAFRARDRDEVRARVQEHVRAARALTAQEAGSASLEVPD